MVFSFPFGKHDQNFNPLLGIFKVYYEKQCHKNAEFGQGHHFSWKKKDRLNHKINVHEARDPELFNLN